MEETLRDGIPSHLGASMSHRRRGPILTAIASFQETGQRGVEFADPMPADVPGPKGLTSAKQLMEPYAEKSPFADFTPAIPFDIRHVTPTIMLGADHRITDRDSGRQMVWMKADGTADVPQVMHRAMLALGCRQIMMEPVLRRAGLSISTPGISMRPSTIRCGGIGISTSTSGICMCRTRRPPLMGVAASRSVFARRQAGRGDGTGSHDPRPRQDPRNLAIGQRNQQHRGVTGSFSQTSYANSLSASPVWGYSQTGDENRASVTSLGNT